MTERPILMSAPMVRSTLDDTKTWTRRAVNPQPPHDPQHDHVDAVGSLHRWWAGRLTLGKQHEARCPYGQPGDRLWVRETYFAWGRWETRFSAKKGRDEWHFVDMTLECGRAYAYAADGAPHDFKKGNQRGGITPTWWKRPAIFMPRAASRITLEITDVRVERLQDISEADAIAEGCAQNHNGYFWGGPHAVSGRKQMATAKDAYRDLWESLNGPGSWDANPWVWVVGFRRIP